MAGAEGTSEKKVKQTGKTTRGSSLDFLEAAPSTHAFEFCPCFDQFKQRCLEWDSQRKLGKPLQAHSHAGPSVEPWSWKYTQWFHDLDDVGKRNMRDALLELDEHVRIDDSDAEVMRIREDVFAIVSAAAGSIGEMEPRFKGNLIKMGSSHNQTKIGSADEFDFSLEVDVRSLTGNQGSVSVNVIGETTYAEIALMCEEGLLENPPFERNGTIFKSLVDAWNLGLELLEEDRAVKDEVRKFLGPNKMSSATILRPRNVIAAFAQVFDDAMSTTELPPNWRHGGFNTPRYSGVRLNTPANVIQLIYVDPSTLKETSVSVDLALIIKIPPELMEQPYEILRGRDVVQDHLHHAGFARFGWCRLAKTKFGLVFTPAEEIWLNTFDFLSVPKKVMRICKALPSMLKLQSDKYIPKELAEIYLKHQRNKEKHEDCTKSYAEVLHQLTLLKRFNFDFSLSCTENIFVPLTDINENLGTEQHISSYKFKRIVMTLMALDEHEGRTWTDDDIPDIIMNSLMLIHDLNLHRGDITQYIEDILKKGKELEVRQTKRLPKFYLELYKSLGICIHMLQLFSMSQNELRVPWKKIKDNLTCMIFEALRKMSEGVKPRLITWHDCAPQEFQDAFLNLLERHHKYTTISSESSVDYGIPADLIGKILRAYEWDDFISREDYAHLNIQNM